MSISAPSKDKVVCIATSAGGLKLATLQDIREDFSRQQQALYQQYVILCIMNIMTGFNILQYTN